MKTLCFFIMLCSCLCISKQGLAQPDYFSEYRKRINPLIENKEYDSIIVYFFHQSLDPPPPPPSKPPGVEILNKQSHYEDAFLVGFKNDSCFAICIADYEAGFGISNRIQIQEELVIDTLRKCWAKAQKEYFLPFVYKNKEKDKPDYGTLNFISPRYANLSFMRPGYCESKDFFPWVNEKTESEKKNINYKHNASLKLFTVHKIMERLYDLFSKQFMYHEY